MSRFTSTTSTVRPSAGHEPAGTPRRSCQAQEFRFEVIDFERNRHITLRQRTSTIGALIFGDVMVSYLLVPQSPNNCRLLAKVVIQYPAPPLGWLTRIFLPWGDFIMMRRQLLNFKELAEGSIHAV